MSQGGGIFPYDDHFVFVHFFLCQTDSKNEENNPMYKEIVDILKDIEQENQKDVSGK